jgi:hypothetical protein
MAAALKPASPTKTRRPTRKELQSDVCKKDIVACLQSIGSYWGHSLTLPLPEPIALIGSIQTQLCSRYANRSDAAWTIH